MIGATLISDRAEIFIIYALAAALHECGHLFTAKLLKIEIREIRFEFSGIRICTGDSVISYKNELLLAVSGPIVSIAIVIIGTSYLGAMGVTYIEATEACKKLLFEGVCSHIGGISFFALASLLQGIINLLPVRTFDGGRISYCIMSCLLGEGAAERFLDIFSALSAFLLWTVALYLMLKVSSGLGIYIFAIILFVSTFNDIKK